MQSQFVSLTFSSYGLKEAEHKRSDMLSYSIKQIKTIPQEWLGKTEYWNNPAKPLKSEFLFSFYVLTSDNKDLIVLLYKCMF